MYLYSYIPYTRTSRNWTKGEVNKGQILGAIILLPAHFISIGKCHVKRLKSLREEPACSHALGHPLDRVDCFGCPWLAQYSISNMGFGDCAVWAGSNLPASTLAKCKRTAHPVCLAPQLGCIDGNQPKPVR